ncbi:class I SAM-dependent methyltransferase [Haloechinothrix halophila]|uniref:class I SAM-dependent methyltransferase n=1 Tax=Haloechinothrix halophila TaxID=1069073 RepID=UPI0003F5606C|nr:class I SAM-dependent methyltransferase [Haloechinothrix halophila]
MRSEDWDEKFAASEFLFTARPNQTVVAETTSLKPGTALDLACGQGRNAVWLAEQGWHVTAVDFSRVGLDRARQLAESRGVDVTYIEADVVNWQPPVQAFDLVLIAYLQLPWEELKTVLAAARKALAPGGTLLLVGHDADNIDHGYGGPPDPAVLYDAQRIRAELDALDVETARQVDRVVDTDIGPMTAIDTLVKATARD